MRYKQGKKRIIALAALLIAAMLVVVYVCVSLNTQSWNPAEWVSTQSGDDGTDKSPIIIPPSTVKPDEPTDPTEPEEPEDPTNPVYADYTIDFTAAAPLEALTVTLPSSGLITFNVVGAESYSCKVTSNVKDLDGSQILNSYYVDGEIYVFFADDYTSEFIPASSIHDSYFTIFCTPGYYELATLLARKWNGREVTFDTPVTEEYPYKLDVTSSEGAVITVLLNQSSQ